MLMQMLQSHGVALMPPCVGIPGKHLSAVGGCHSWYVPHAKLVFALSFG